MQIPYVISSSMKCWHDKMWNNTNEKLKSIVFMFDNVCNFYIVYIVLLFVCSPSKYTKNRLKLTQTSFCGFEIERWIIPKGHSNSSVE